MGPSWKHLKEDARFARFLLVPSKMNFPRIQGDDSCRIASGLVCCQRVLGCGGSGCARRRAARRGVGYQNRPAGASAFCGLARVAGLPLRHGTTLRNRRWGELGDAEGRDLDLGIAGRRSGDGNAVAPDFLALQVQLVVPDDSVSAGIDPNGTEQAGNGPQCLERLPPRNQRRNIVAFHDPVAKRGFQNRIPDGDDARELVVHRIATEEDRWKCGGLCSAAPKNILTTRP